MWLAREAVSLLPPAQSKTTGSHHLALGNTTAKTFCKNWQLLAPSPEYRLGVSDAVVAGGERMASRRALERDKWGLGGAVEEVGSLVDRYGAPLNMRHH